MSAYARGGFGLRESATGLLGYQLDVGGFQCFQDASSHFAGFGMAAHFLLGENQLPIDGDIKDAASAGNQLPTAYVKLNFALVQDFVRQTDGLWLVSSSGAILDDDVHSTLLHGTAPFLLASSDDKHPYLKLPCGVKMREATLQAALSVAYSTDKPAKAFTCSIILPAFPPAKKRVTR